MNQKEIKNLINENKNKYYVYGLFHRGKPFYIGKGSNNRIFKHVKCNDTNVEKIRKIKTLELFGENIEYVIFSFHESEIKAFEEEKTLICKYWNCLTNKVRGYGSSKERKANSKTGKHILFVLDDKIHEMAKRDMEQVHKSNWDEYFDFIIKLRLGLVKVKFTKKKKS